MNIQKLLTSDIRFIPVALKKPPEQVAKPTKHPLESGDTVKTVIPLGHNMTMLTFENMSPQSYQQAVERIQARVDHDLALQNTAVPREKYIRQNYQSIFQAQPNPDAKGTVVMLHGYTAGPWQYEEMGTQFFEAGYNVYVPRFPGHGWMQSDGTPTGEDMVEASDLHIYEDFISQVFAESEALGAPVHLIGLSGGSNLALRMAEKHPQVKSVVAMTPYIGPNQPKQFLKDGLESFDRWTLGAIGRILERFPYNENTKVALDHPMPHTQGSLSNAKAMLTMGTRVESVEVPVQFFTTAGDELSGTEPVSDLFNRSGGSGAHGWYHFNEADKVPYAMASPKQNTEPGRSAFLHQRIFEAIDQGLFSNRLPQ